MTQANALDNYFSARATQKPAFDRNVSLVEAESLLKKAHSDTAFCTQEPGSAALQLLAGIDDNTLCLICSVVARHAKTVTNPMEFEDMAKALEATEDLACFLAGMGSN